MTDTCESAEYSAIKAGRGLWGDPNTPKTGWTWIAEEDLEEKVGSCQMCNTRIRYLHHLHHEATGLDIAAGCICAGHLVNDIPTVKARDTAMRNAARKRKRDAEKAAAAAEKARVEADRIAAEQWQTEAVRTLNTPAHFTSAAAQERYATALAEVSDEFDRYLADEDALLWTPTPNGWKAQGTGDFMLYRVYFIKDGAWFVLLTEHNGNESSTADPHKDALEARRYLEDWLAKNAVHKNSSCTA